MSPDHKKFDEYAGSPSARLLNDPYRLPLEEVVSDFFRQKWRVRTFRDMDEFSSHPAAILSDGKQAIFVKLSEAANGSDQFEAELAGLQRLSELAGVLIPSPIDLVTVEGGVILVLEAARAKDRKTHHWREIGRTLARIHRIKGNYYGWDRQGYFGPLYQDNRPMPDWPGFFIERRLWPRLVGAIDSGNMPSDTIRQVEKLISRLHRLDLPQGEPCLLHGDAQQNNFISTAQGAMVIDPAVYYGNPEMDLAHIDYFQPVPQVVFDGYRELLPIDPGFNDRRDLWRIPGYLALVTVGGARYLDKLSEAVLKYL